MALQPAWGSCDAIWAKIKPRPHALECKGVATAQRWNEVTLQGLGADDETQTPTWASMPRGRIMPRWQATWAQGIRCDRHARDGFDRRGWAMGPQGLPGLPGDGDPEV